MNIDDFRLSIGWSSRLQRGFLKSRRSRETNDYRLNTNDYLRGGGSLMAGLCNHTELGGATVVPFRRPSPAIKTSCSSPSYLQRTPQACLHPSTFEINQFDIHYSFHPPSCPSLPRVSQATQAWQGDEVAGSKPSGSEGARSERAQSVLIPRVLPRNTRQAALRTVHPSLFFILLSCQKKTSSSLYVVKKTN